MKLWLLSLSLLIVIVMVVSFSMAQEPATSAESNASSEYSDANTILLHHLSYDSTEHRSDSGDPDVLAYGTGLDLSNTEVVDDDLQQLKLPAFERVRWLNLRGTAVTDEGLKHLKHLKHLRTLILENTEVSGEGFKVLCSLPLENLVLEMTPVTDEGLRNLANCPIKELNLTDTRITDGGIEHLKKLPKLRSLNLYSTDVTNAGVHFLYDLRLEKLFLTGTKISDAEIERLRFKLPDLLIIH